MKTFRKRSLIAVGAITAVFIGGAVVSATNSDTTKALAYYSIPAVRVLDTRDPAIPAVGVKGTLDFTIPGLPDDVKAVDLNVTVTNGTANSFLVVYPVAESLPSTSNVNWPAKTNVANKSNVNIGADHKLRLYNEAGTVDVIIDITGYYAPSPSNGGAPGPKGDPGIQGIPGPSSIVQVSDFSGLWKPRAADAAGVKMTGDGIKSGPLDASQCDTPGVDYTRLDFSGLNGKPLSSLTSLVLHARYIADNDTSGIGAPSVRVTFVGTEGGGTTNRLTFSANTQFDQPINYDLGQGEMHEWVVTSGTLRMNDDAGGTNPDLPWDSYVTTYGARNITNIDVLSGCGMGDNLVTLIRRAEVNGITYVFGAN